MSALIQARGEAGGGVAAHLQCPHCGNFSRSHAHQLSHFATSHPSSLDGVAVGRLGNILMYQSGARLFHCAECFFTSRDFTKLYKHIITKHCTDGKDGGEVGDDGSDKGEEEEEEEEGCKGVLKRKTTRDPEEKEQGKKDRVKKKLSRKAVEGEQMGEDALKKTRETEEDVQRKEDEVKQETKGKEDGAEGEGSSKVDEEIRGKADTQEENDELNRKTSAEEGECERKRSSKAEGDGVAPEEVKPDNGEGGKTVLLEIGAHRCLICGWKNKLKALTVNHVVRKHDIPKAFASQAIRRDSADSADNQLATEEEELPVGLSAEQLKEEMDALAKVVRFTCSRFVCVICGWKTKLKGFAISHVMRSHDIERPYSCKDCKRSFFLPSRLQQHVKATHRPGRYACPFCYFRSEFLGGFRRHCSRCNAREEEDEEEGGGRASGGRGGGGGGGGGGRVGAGGERREEEDENEEEGEKNERRATRKRRKTVKMMEEEEDDNDDDEEV